MAFRFSRRYATLVAVVLAPLAVCGVLVPFRSVARIHDTATLAYSGAAPGDVVERVRVQLVDVLSL